MREVINELLSAASRPPEDGKQMLNLAASVDLDSYFLDTTCVKLNIHFPNALSSSCASGLGTFERRRADTDESDDADPQRMRFKGLAPAA